MNSYQNKNNDEILSSSSNQSNMFNAYPKYPLASMQNTNYKEWMNQSENITPSSFTAIFTALRIVNGAISFLGVSSELETSFQVISRLLGFINRGTGNDLLTLTEQLINQTLATQYRNAATGAVYAIARAYEDYLKWFRQWQANPTAQNGSQLETEFGTVNTLCISVLTYGNTLARRGFETLLLPNYAVAANFHLLLLRDAALFRDSWTETSNLTKDLNLGRLRDSIREYSNHCKRWYEDGLNRLRNARPGDPFGPRGDDWIRFNAYRRDMTLAVLDLVTIFPTYDPSLFPGSTSVQLSRIVYTDPVALAQPQEWFFRDLEHALTFRGTVSFLNEMDVYYWYYFRPHNVDRNYWAGNRNFLSNRTSVLTGQSTSARRRLDMKNRDIFRVDMSSHEGGAFNDNYRGIHRANFLGVNIQTNQATNVLFQVNFNANGFQHNNHSRFLPGEEREVPNANDYTHRLFQVLNAVHTTHNVRTTFFSHAWTHKSLTRQNTFSADKILQIPAVKTVSNSAERAVISNTGENVIKLDNLTTNLLYPLTSADLQSSNTRFIVRIRYASMSNNRLNLLLNDAQVALLNAERTVRSGGALDNLQYEDFKYATFAGNFKMGSHSILGIFKETSNTEFVLDKIELIPVGTFANQLLEETIDYNKDCHQNSSIMYDQNFNTYDQNMENTYDQSYNTY
ncbi:insecticidal delta-endotoxin Cry8Ea1 family protein, partial [Bacillus cereus]|nr:insecticidal delta-endotoxin Cry8Ea1 family protein [Bacillus cereus]